MNLIHQTASRWQRPSRIVDTLPVTLAGRVIAKRYRLPPVIADLVADLAGFREAR